MPIATSTCITNTCVSAFSFEGADVRVLNRSDEPWWVLADVCNVLEVGSPHKVANRLDDDEKGRTIIPTLGGPQETTIINESGLYSLILTSRKPAAKRFKKWVTAEVLPAIRKTGGYMAAAPKSRLTVLGTIVPQCLEASFNKSASGFSTVRQARLVSAPVVNLIRQFWLEANLKADGLTFHSL